MEKKTVFIKVNCIDRLPLVSGYYHTNKGIVHYSDIFEDWNQDDIEHWLEEIELPGDEEIKKFINEQPYYGSCNHEYHEGIEEGANFILNQLKSNTNETDKI